MKIRVLIVDDLPFMREVIRDILLEADFRIVGEAQNGRDGVISFMKRKPDIVLLDIAMPVMDGITALRRIMSYDPSARVVMCSALGEEEMIIRAIQLGAKDFVVKPFQAERIISAVNKAAKTGR